MVESLSYGSVLVEGEGDVADGGEHPGAGDCAVFEDGICEGVEFDEGFGFLLVISFFESSMELHVYS